MLCYEYTRSPAPVLSYPYTVPVLYALLGVAIEMSLAKDNSLTVVITGKDEAVMRARKLVTERLQTQVRGKKPKGKKDNCCNCRIVTNIALRNILL